MSELGDKERRFVEDQRRIDEFGKIQAPQYLVIGDAKGQDLVKVHFDGTLEFGESYDPDEAARCFWEAIGNWAGNPDALLTEKDAEIERLKAILDEDNSIAEDAIICCDCGKEAGPSCDYFGHGLAELADLIDAFSNPVESADTRTLLAEAAEVLLELAVDETKIPDEMIRWYEDRAKPFLEKLGARE